MRSWLFLHNPYEADLERHDRENVTYIRPRRDEGLPALHLQGFGLTTASQRQLWEWRRLSEQWKLWKRQFEDDLQTHAPFVVTPDALGERL